MAEAQQIMYRPEQQVVPAFNRPIDMPQGIDTRPFRHIRRSHLVVRPPDLKRQFDPQALEPCVNAVLQTRDILNYTRQDGEPLYDVLFTEAENAAHREQYVAQTLQAIDTLASGHGHVTVAIDLIGGLAPGEPVMKAVGEHPDLARRVDFVPVFKNGFKPEKVRQRVEQNGSGAFLHVDDGATHMTTQAKAALALTGDEAFAEYIAEIEATKKLVDSCKDPQLDPVFMAMIQRSMDRRLVIMPYYMKNNRYREMLGQVVAENPNTPWAQAQAAIMDQGAVKHLEEHHTAVGAMVDDNPCRDHGVSAKELIGSGLLTEKAEEHLVKGNMADVEFRLLANDKRTLQLRDGADKVVTQYFAHLLNQNVLM